MRHRSSTAVTVPRRNDWRDALYDNDLTRVAQWLAPDGALVRNLNVFDTGESLLHWAATMDRPDMVALMLRYGSPNQANQEGQTPLMAAASVGALATVKVLLPVSDPSRRDHQGRNALDIARETGEPTLIQVLEATELRQVLNDQPVEVRLQPHARL